MEEKALDLDWNLKTRLSYLLWNTALKIELSYVKIEVKCGYKHVPKPMAPWLKNCLMAYCDLSEEDVKKCGEYFNNH